MDAIFLVLGLVGLWFGSAMTLKGVLTISRKFRLPAFIVGGVILSVGTNLPEIFITLVAAFEKRVGIANASGVILGNALGSTLGQGTLILGIAGLFGALSLTPLMRKQCLVMPATLLFLLSIVQDGVLSFWEGVWLIFAYIAFLVHGILFSKRKKTAYPSEKYRPLHSSVQFVGGLALMLYASKLTVDSVVHLSLAYQVSQTFLSVFVIGLGTSLPELATTVAAVRNREGEIAVGNIIGSCVLDTLLLPGLGAVINFSMPVPEEILSFHAPLTAVMLSLIACLLMFRSPFGKVKSIIAITLYPTYYFLQVVTSRI